MSNDKIQAVGVNIAEKATMIWNVADMLRGPFKPHEYGLVILPMTVVKRFHDCLLPTHEAVLAQYEKVKKLAVIDGFPVISSTIPASSHLKSCWLTRITSKPTSGTIWLGSLPMSRMFCPNSILTTSSRETV